MIMEMIVAIMNKPNAVAHRATLRIVGAMIGPIINRAKTMLSAMGRAVPVQGMTCAKAGACPTTIAASNTSSTIGAATT